MADADREPTSPGARQILARAMQVDRMVPELSAFASRVAYVRNCLREAISRRDVEAVELNANALLALGSNAALLARHLRDEMARLGARIEQRTPGTRSSFSEAAELIEACWRDGSPPAARSGVWIEKAGTFDADGRAG